jgi:hypothetical protein
MDGADEGPRVRSDHQAVTCQGGERTAARPDSRSRWRAIVPQPALGLPATDAPPVQSTQKMGNMCAGRSRGRGKQRVPDSAIRANPAPAGPTEAITVCDGRHGTGVWPEFRERPRPARISAPLTAGHRGTARNAAGHLPIRTTLGGWFTAAVGPARARYRTCARKGSGQRPGRSGSLEAIRAATAAWLCDVLLQGGERWPGCAAAAPGSGPCTRCTTTPDGRLVFHGCAAWPS